MPLFIFNVVMMLQNMRKGGSMRINLYKMTPFPTKGTPELLSVNNELIRSLDACNLSSVVSYVM